MMNWVLVVSGDDDFQQRSMAALRGERAVGAISDASARRLVGSLRPDLVLVDGSDEYGHQFLASLRLLPEKARPQAIVVGGSAVGFSEAPSVEKALTLATPAVVAA
jgi:hypothetical protein